MSIDFAKTAFNTFLDTLGAQNLVNVHTASGYKAAAARILEQVPDDTDVRTVDLDTEVRRYNNAHPGLLSPKSLTAYKSRLEVAVKEFQKYVADPAAYKGRGRSPVEGAAAKRAEAKGKTAVSVAGKADMTIAAVGTATTATSGLSLAFPLRKDFLAQVVVPRDLKVDEARRFTAFIMTLAFDFDPLMK